MFDKILSLFGKREDIVPDAVKTVGWVALFLDRKFVANWAKTKIRQMFRNQKILSFLRGSERFLVAIIGQMALGAFIQVVAYIAIILALAGLKVNGYNLPRGAMLAIGGLCIGLLVNGIFVFIAGKLQAFTELLLAAVDTFGSVIDGAKHTLPTFLQFDWNLMPDEKRTKWQNAYRVPYMLVFWNGVINLLISVVICINFRVFAGAILVPMLLTVFLAGLGLLVGYNVKSDLARKLATTALYLLPALGLLIIAIGPHNIAGWFKSDPLVVQKTTIIAERRDKELKEVPALDDEIKNLASVSPQTEENTKQLAFKTKLRAWLMNDDPKRGPRPTEDFVPTPTCSNGKDDNLNGFIDQADASCYSPVDKSVCIETIGGRPALKSNCRKQGTHYFEYNLNLNEHDMPKTPVSDNSVGGGGQHHTPAPTPTPPTPAVVTGSTAAGRASLALAKEYGIPIE